jgi:Uncharacterized protein conserved in archaea
MGRSACRTRGGGRGRRTSWSTSSRAEGLLPARKGSIQELLGSDDPKVPTVGGGYHRFSRRSLEKAAEVVPKELWSVPIFPITFSSGDELGKGVVIIRSKAEAVAFSKLMGLSDLPKTPEGYHYTYKVLVVDFLRRYPSLGVISV